MRSHMKPRFFRTRCLLPCLGVLGILATLPSTSWADTRGVTLFDREGFRGEREHFTADTPYLERRGRYGIGDDQARSISVDRGCQATLYSRTRFRGRSVRIHSDQESLRFTPIGLDEVSSLRVTCERRSSGHYDSPYVDPYRHDDRGELKYGEGVLLFEHKNMGGRRLFTDRDIANMRDTTLGNDRLTSIVVAPGCRAVLYRDAHFRGGRIEVRDSERHLGHTPIGNDSVSSIRVYCERYSDPHDVEGITLFEHDDFRGRRQTFTRDIPNLKRTHFGNDRASSVEVPRGCRVTLFEHKNYQGRSVRLRRSEDSLRRTPLGNDRASSLRVDCRRGGRGW